MKTVDSETQNLPLEASCEHSKDAEITECPECAIYRIAGDDVPVVKLLLMEMYTRYGDYTGSFMYLPLEIVMKALVGTGTCVGYIQSISEGEPCEISVEFYESHRDCLKYALLQVFPNLTIEIIDQ